MDSFKLKLTLGVLLASSGCLPKKKNDVRQSNQPVASDKGDDFILFGSKPAKLLAEEEAVYAQPGACVLINVNVMDAEDFSVSADKDTTVLLSATPANVTFYSDPACSTSSTSFSISKGLSGGGTYAKAPASGATKVNFKDASAGGLAEATASFHAANVTQLASRSGGVPLDVNECTPQSVIAHDAESHPVFLATGMTLAASTSASSGKFYSDDQCTKEATQFKIKAGEWESEEIYYKDSAAGTPALTFSDVGNPAVKKVSVNVTVTQESNVTP